MVMKSKKVHTVERQEKFIEKGGNCMKKIVKKSTMKFSDGIREKYVINCLMFSVSFTRFVENDKTNKKNEKNARKTIEK